MDYIVTLTDEETKALSTEVLDIQKWINHIAHDRARQAIDRVVNKHSIYQASKLTEPEKLDIIKKTKLETAAQKAARTERELKSG